MYIDKHCSRLTCFCLRPSVSATEDKLVFLKHCSIWKLPLLDTAWFWAKHWMRKTRTMTANVALDSNPISFSCVYSRAVLRFNRIALCAALLWRSSTFVPGNVQWLTCGVMQCLVMAQRHTTRDYNSVTRTSNILLFAVATKPVIFLSIFVTVATSFSCHVTVCLITPPRQAKMT